MSDLISRSELLKAMNTWDKFGYDCHRGLVRIDSTNEEYVPYVRYEDMVRCVNDMQTAYDIDKVVEELGHKKEEVQRMRNTCVALSDLEVCDIENVTYKRAIEIVKQSGVSSDVCECRLIKGYNFLHKTSCDNVFNMERDFKYCPYCGKKIKVVE